MTGWLAVLALLLALGSVASYLRLLMRRLTPVGARKVFGPSEVGQSVPIASAWACRYPPCTAPPCTCLRWA